MPVLILCIYNTVVQFFLFSLLIVVIAICYSTLVRCTYIVSIKGHGRRICRGRLSGDKTRHVLLLVFFSNFFICLCFFSPVHRVFNWSPADCTCHAQKNSIKVQTKKHRAQFRALRRR